jgi:hypothetical protein
LWTSNAVSLAAWRDILAVTANLDTVKGQLAQQEQTSGSLADL